MTAIEFRPRSVSELVDASFQVLRQNFGPLAVIAALTVAPSVIINVVTSRLADAITNPAAGTLPSPARAFWFLPITLIGTCWTFVGVGALVAAVADACARKPVDPAGSFRRAFARAWTLIGAHLLVYLIAFGLFLVGAVLAGVLIPILVKGVGTGTAGSVGPLATVALVSTVLIFGGLAWMVIAVARYYVVGPSIMIEGVGVMASLRRSRSLSAGHMKRIVGMLFLIAIVGVVVYGTIYGVTQAVTKDRNVLNAVFGVLAIPLYPLVVSLMTLLYYDLRIRKEGYDIELMAQQIGDGGSPDAGAAGNAAATTAAVSR